MAEPIPTPMPPQAPRKETGALRKDISTVGGSLFDGITRGVLSGAWQFGKAGLAIGGVIALLTFPLGTSILGIIVGWTATAAALGAVGMLGLNIVKGLFNGVKDVIYRHRVEGDMRREQERAQEQSQGKAQSQSLPSSFSLSSGPSVSEAIRNDTTQLAASAPSSGVTSHTVSGDSVSASVSPEGGNSSMTANEASASVKTATHSAASIHGQGPSGGGSWEELVRRNSSPHLQGRV